MIWEEFEKLGGCDKNLLALIVARSICEGRSKEEIGEIFEFLQLVICNLKTYMR